MATIVCQQGLQSCLESQIVESRILRLKLSSPKPLLFSHPLELALKPCSAESNEFRFQNSDNGGWSFLQDLSNSSPVDKENVYIHPLMKRYSSKLSEKSLELCTESLGCETGSDILSENSFLFDSSISSSSSELDSDEEEEEEARNSNSIQNQNQSQNLQKQKPGQISEAKKVTNRSFPPPLTTMSGAESLHVRPHREDGRLIIMAVKAPAIRSCLQAERTDGRLRLSFVKDYASNFDSDENEEEEEETENDAEEEEEGEEEMEEANCESAIQEEEDAEGIKLKVGGEIGKKEFEIGRRRSSCRRCKEEKEGLLNWEPFWVAT